MSNTKDWMALTYWRIEIQGKGETGQPKIKDLHEPLPAGTHLAVHGTVPEASYVYVLARSGTKAKPVIELLYPAAKHTEHVEAGVEVRLPPEGKWLTLDKAASIVVIGAKRPFSLKELIEALHGREPDPLSGKKGG